MVRRDEAASIYASAEAQGLTTSEFTRVALLARVDAVAAEAPVSAPKPAPEDAPAEAPPPTTRQLILLSGLRTRKGADDDEDYPRPETRAEADELIERLEALPDLDEDGNE